MPIAFAYNMVAAEIDPMRQVEMLRRAVGISLRYFATLIMAGYHCRGCFNVEKNRYLRNQVSRPITDGGWFHIARSIARSYLEMGQAPFLIRELPSLWVDGLKRSTKLSGICRSIIDLRNEIHEMHTFDESTAKHWLLRALPKWTQKTATWPVGTR